MAEAKTDVNTIRARVQGMLTEMGNVTVDRNGHFSFASGSTRVFVMINEKDDFSYLSVYSPVLYEVPVTPDLYKYVAEATNSYLFGHLLMIMQEDGTADLGFQQNIVADYVDFEELKHSLLAVAYTADDLDDELSARFGGRRFGGE